MCGRFTLTDLSALGGRYGVELPEEARDPRFNVSPSQLVPAIVATENGRVFRWMQWGFRPAWAKDQHGRPPINARAETLLERPLFRGAVARNRCLIAADGFYEWQTIEGQRQKQPLYVRLRSGEPFVFAGLFTERRAADGELEASCVIITTAANSLMASFHHRMPVILSPADASVWLDPARRDPASLLPLLKQYPADAMEAYRVGSLVSSSAYDGPTLIQPLF